MLKVVPISLIDASAKHVRYNPKAGNSLLPSQPGKPYFQNVAPPFLKKKMRVKELLRNLVWQRRGCVRVSLSAVPCSYPGTSEVFVVKLGENRRRCCLGS